MSSLTQTGIVRTYNSFAQSCLTLCDLMDCSTPGLPIHHQLLELAQIHVHLVGSFPFYRGCSQPRDRTQDSRTAGGFFISWANKGSPRILECVAYPFSGGSSRPRNQTGLLHWRWIPYQLSYQGNPSSCLITHFLEEQIRFYFLGSKIMADADCSHEVRRCLLLGRKAMTNLDSILISRDIPLRTKVCLVKDTVFPGVMCGCESWTIKKTESQRIDAFKLWCWKSPLRVPWTVRRSNQS